MEGVKADEACLVDGQVDAASPSSPVLSRDPDLVSDDARLEASSIFFVRMRCLCPFFFVCVCKLISHSYVFNLFYALSLSLSLSLSFCMELIISRER